jgi:hypothetical protein
MLSNELEALKRLNIPVKRWGSSFRVKVKNQNGRSVYISNFETGRNRKLLAKTYKLSESRVERNLDKDYKRPGAYSFFKNKVLESHLYEYYTRDQIDDKIRSTLKGQKKAFKVNVQLGYKLIDRVSGLERNYWPATNTAIFDKPIAINSKDDIESKVMGFMQSKDFTERISYPSSSYQLKEITMSKIVITYRDHTLGENIVIPDAIKKNRFIIDFPKTENKCAFFCIAYHLNGDARVDRMASLVKPRIKQYCEFKNIDYSPKFYKEMEPIDLLQFDELEDCFQLRMNVYEMDQDTLEISLIRESKKDYSNRINILDYQGHAMYITDLDMVLSKYPCNVCEAIFSTWKKLGDHKKTKCEFEVLESFPKTPTIYSPPKNQIQRLLNKFGVKGIDHYIDHFIVYDFEAILKPTTIQHGSSTTYTNQHIPVSVSVCNSLTEEVRCFVSDSPIELLTDMFAYIEEISSEIRRYNVSKYEKLLRRIIKDEGQMELSVIDKLITNGEDYESFFDIHEFVDDLSAIKDHGDYRKIKRVIDQVPVFGFNSGSYDINLIKNDLFTVIGVSNIKSVIKNPSYMCIATNSFKMLDISNYVPAGTSYDSYLTTYLGGCKCDDKIRCVCGLSKGVFPYEYVKSFEVLNETEIPSKSAFDSSLRGTSISDDDYERVKFVWGHYGMKSIKDLLVWYNNLDVKPFVKAIKAQRELFKKFDLDMFSDGVSLPGLSEKVMYQTCFKSLKPIEKPKGIRFEFPTERFHGYEAQDVKAGREFNMNIDYLNQLLRKQKFICCHCFCKLDATNASADRINNELGHIDGNIMISCIQCNVARKDMNPKAFRYKKMMEANGDKLVYSIDEEQKDIYHKMKANIAGGPSIIFNRFAKRNETKIRGGKLCKKIIGYDANALYLWALGNEMPCGRLTTVEAYEGIIDDIKADKIFGFLECDIRTPEHLKDYFSEMTPIFKNALIDCTDKSIVGEHMFDYNASKGNRAKPARKLIGSYFGEKILIYTPLLKWYLEHGMEITKMHSFIKASSHKAFAPFMEAVSDARRAGDVDKSQAMIAEMMKLVGNSAFGRSGMDKSKHKEVKYEPSDAKVRAIVEKQNFHDVEELAGSYEVSLKKRRIKLNNPIHLSIAIYQLAKLRMLQFYYDCIDKYFDRSDFQYQEMDTDSGYIAFSFDNPFEECIKPELKDHFSQHKYDWFPRDYDEEVAKYDRRTPGLFKEEWRGDAMVSLSSKNYICYLPDETHKVKVSAKGVQQGRGRNSDVLSPTGFESVVRDRITLSGTNKGFRISKESKSVITYTQQKTALNYYYDKRQVLADGISTIPLEI